MNNKLDLAAKVEEVMDLVDRGDISSEEEVLAEFEGYKVDLELLEEIAREEFVDGYSEKWEKLVERD